MTDAAFANCAAFYAPLVDEMSAARRMAVASGFRGKGSSQALWNSRTGSGPVMDLRMK